MTISERSQSAKAELDPRKIQLCLPPNYTYNYARVSRLNPLDLLCRPPNTPKKVGVERAAEYSDLRARTCMSFKFFNNIFLVLELLILDFRYLRIVLF